MAKNKEETKEYLFEEFCKSFPYFKPNVRCYFLRGDDKLKIYTKQGGKFIFELNKNGIGLYSA